MNWNCSGCQVLLKIDTANLLPNVSTSHQYPFEDNQPPPPDLKLDLRLDLDFDLESGTSTGSLFSPCHAIVSCFYAPVESPIPPCRTKYPSFSSRSSACGGSRLRTTRCEPESARSFLLPNGSARPEERVSALFFFALILAIPSPNRIGDGSTCC